MTSYWPGPDVADVAKRLRAAGFDDEFIAAYLDEETRRHTARARVEAQSVVDAHARAFAQLKRDLAAFLTPRLTPRRTARPTFLTTPAVSDYGRKVTRTYRVTTWGEEPARVIALHDKPKPAGESR